MTGDPSDTSGEKPDGVRVTAATCVRCGKPVTPRTRPFCSQRCADIDLGAWFKGSYRVETEEQPETAETPAPRPGPPDGN